MKKVIYFIFDKTLVIILVFCNKTLYNIQLSVLIRTRPKDFDSTVTRKVLYSTLKNVMV
jgi:hypothetical protein